MGRWLCIPMLKSFEEGAGRLGGGGGGGRG